jgi:putative two-component system response regulator
MSVNTQVTTPRPPARPVDTISEAASSSFAASWLNHWFTSYIVCEEDWEGLPENTRIKIKASQDLPDLVRSLQDVNLITPYQASRMRMHQEYGLLLGSYRVQDIIGSGGMGVVYLGEHICLRHHVAIKTLHTSLSRSPSWQDLSRFFTEARAIAQIQHPHVVRSLDVGTLNPTDATETPVHYFVMEYVDGQNLEAYVNHRGPLAMQDACEFAHQIASALAETHRFGIIHRDIKPSNILITNQGQTKLVDFGLMRNFRNRLTEPGTILGTIDYMSPEQSRDASLVDFRTDLYSLGGTLYWMLTGRLPFKQRKTAVEELTARQTQLPPAVRELRPDLPVELDFMIQRMMAIKREDRFQSAREVMQSLLRYLRQESYELQVMPSLADISLPPVDMPVDTKAPRGAGAPHTPRPHKVLIVDDDVAMHQFITLSLQPAGIRCEAVTSGPKALEAIQKKPFDLVLLDVDLQPKGMTGLDVCRRLRNSGAPPRLKIIMISGQSSDVLAKSLGEGADDFLNKPFTPVQLQARVKASLRLKYAQDKSDLLNRHLMAVNAEMERNLQQRQSDLLHIRLALVKILQRTMIQSSIVTEDQLRRLSRYARLLGELAINVPAYKGKIDPAFIEQLEACITLSEIGCIGLPHEIFFKPGNFTENERLIMQTHTVLGAEMLREVAEEHRSAAGFLLMASEIARSHHEQYQGKGYPDGITGEQIPLAARITALVSTYDALRSRRVHKPALGHEATMQVLHAEAAHFDPNLFNLFVREAKSFERVFHEGNP